MATGTVRGQRAAPPNGSGTREAVRPGGVARARTPPPSSGEGGGPCALPLCAGYGPSGPIEGWAGGKSDESGETDAARGAGKAPPLYPVEVLSQRPAPSSRGGRRRQPSW